MTFSADEKYHLARLRDRLDAPGAKASFTRLFEWACIGSPLFVWPISRGAFSAIHLSFESAARPYADCEFAFKGSKQYVKWYFREPAFDSGLVTPSGVTSNFPQAESKTNSREMTLDLHDLAETDALIDFVKRAFFPPA